MNNVIVGFCIGVSLAYLAGLRIPLGAIFILLVFGAVCLLQRFETN